MQYREIVAITGLGGLYHLLGSKSDGAIVRSLGDNTTKFISSRQHNVTPLESIEIYTIGENARLHEVLQKMKDSSQERPSANATTQEIRSYFSQVYPEMDMDRVYASDMKKMLKWYELLQAADLLDFSALNTAEVAEENKPEAAPIAEAEAEKPAKKARAKKTETTEAGEEKASKKTARKKSEDEASEKPAKAKKKAE